MGQTNRRADGNGLSSEPHKWSAAGTCRNPRGTTARDFVEAIGIHFVYVLEDNSLCINFTKPTNLLFRLLHTKD